MVQGNEPAGSITYWYPQTKFNYMTVRIKTLEQISEQYDRITDYLTEQNRYKSACKVDEIFNATFDRILTAIGITEIDDEAIEIAFNEPMLVSEYQRLP